MNSQPEKPQKLLIIDDEPGPRESLRFLFNQQYTVVTAASVDDGIQQLKGNPFDAIVMDIKMPGKSGLEGLNEIRAIDSDVSILMLTGFASLETAQKAIRLGANDYLQKPFDVSEMRKSVHDAVVRTFMNRLRRQTEVKLLGLNRDLQRRLEEQNRLAELGQASQAFVHDLRNPLTVIGGYVEILTSRFETMRTFEPDRQQEMCEYLRLIEQGMEHCRQMSTQWQDLGRLTPERFSSFLAAVLVKEVESTSIPHARGQKVKLLLHQGPEVCLKGDYHQLLRALQNLVHNAIDAASQAAGARVELKWRQLQLQAEITIEDNGPGIPAEILSNLFEPYFSTKKPAGGMGLGLFIAKSIVEAHRGTLSIDNRGGGGARAVIILPLEQS